MSQFVFDLAKVRLGDGTFAWPSSSSPVRVLLIRDGFVPAQGAANLSGIAAHECSGPGYQRKPLDNRAVVEDAAAHRALYDSDDLVWSSAGFGTVTGALVYLQVGGDDSTPLDDIPLVYFDWATATNGGDLTLQFSQTPSAVFAVS